MTDKARDLGLKDTTFKNASGLPNTAQVTTAYDLALLADALLEKHGQYYHYFENESVLLGPDGLPNHNELVGTWTAWTASRPATPAPPGST
jgi:D-alanyl-D-alanine carboxypeptidase